jgi:hypothetical protein
MIEVQKRFAAIVPKAMPGASQSFGKHLGKKKQACPAAA